MHCHGPRWVVDGRRPCRGEWHATSRTMPSANLPARPPGPIGRCRRGTAQPLAGKMTRQVVTWTALAAFIRASDSSLTAYQLLCAVSLSSNRICGRVGGRDPSCMLERAGRLAEGSRRRQSTNGPYSPVARAMFGPVHERRRKRGERVSVSGNGTAAALPASAAVKAAHAECHRSWPRPRTARLDPPCRIEEVDKCCKDPAAGLPGTGG